MPSRLLILEQLPEIGRAYTRSLRRYRVEELVVAESAQEAEAFLERDPVPTSLVCDYSPADGQPAGAELVACWKRRYPHLDKVVLVTGPGSTVARSAPGIDAVFAKPPDMEAVARALGLERREPT